MDVRWSPEPVTVSVPASSANLGPGFDSFGLALGRYDEVTLAVAGTGLSVDVHGEGARTVARDETNLVVRAVRAAFAQIGPQPAGLRLSCRNVVPHGRGLGSSAAAVVAGIVAARELAVRSGVAAAEPLVGTSALRLAAAMEGHPDNVAAALLGGLTLAWAEPAGPCAVRLEPTVSAVLLVAPQPVSTELARGLLPERVPHRDAAANSARAGLLVAALTSRADLLLPATEDLLHQDYREPVLGDSLRLVRRLRAAGHAAVVSGAGPSVLILCDPAVAGSPPRAELVEQLAAFAPGWEASSVETDPHGAQTGTPPPKDPTLGRL